MTRDLYRPDPAAQAAVLEALAAGSARGRREAELARSAPDRAAALRDVETLLRSVSAVYPGDDSDACGYFYVSRDEDFSDGYDLPAFAALIVDRVLGAEQDGETPC